MKAIQIKQFGTTDVLEMVDLAELELGADEVCIEIKAISFNPVDYKIRRGDFDLQLPLVLGSDVSGVVKAIGDRVQHVKVGDQVMAYLMRAARYGGYAEKVWVHQNFVSKIPKNIDLVSAAAIPLVSLTAYESVVVQAKLKPNESVLIAGASGGVGSMVVQMAQAIGAKPIIVTVGSEKSANYLAEHFAIKPENMLFYLDLNLEQLTEKIQKNYPDGFDVCLDFVGGLMKLLCLSTVGFGGRVVSIVEEKKPIDLAIFDARQSPLFAKSASFHFEFLGARALFGAAKDWQVYQTELQAIVKLFETGQLKLPKITLMGDFSVKNIIKAHEQLETGAQGKLVLKVSC